ncbi:hypothetical protein RJT13_02835 [Segatella copri]|uniref:hypothetical protein n=1 Tax=Segatella copri TaxID=165179 RepID=UPI002916F020|nr:hypothetical protein [Segatella copri]MDV3120596.1 hypothetical protein [Segatella copri]
MEVTEEDKKRVVLLLKKFKPRILRLAVNYVSFDSSFSEMKNYLQEHMEFHPNQRELYELSLQLDESEENELNILSRNIATKGYDLDEIIPLD